MRIRALTIGLLLVWAFLSVDVKADEPEFEFGLYKHSDSLAAWVDLAPLLNSVWIEQLSDGLDYSINCEFALLRPRRLWGNARVAEAVTSFQISYLRLTEEYRVSRIEAEGSVELKLSSQAMLYRWLTDSVYANLVLVDSLQGDRRHILEIRIETISGSLAGLVEDGRSGSNSPVRYLFDKFLDLSGLGQENHEIRSAPFLVSDLSER